MMERRLRERAGGNAWRTPDSRRRGRGKTWMLAKETKCTVGDSRIIVASQGGMLSSDVLAPDNIASGRYTQIQQAELGH